MNHTLLSPFGLKWNPFGSELPTEALYLSPKINDFFWRVENLIWKPTCIRIRVPFCRWSRLWHTKLAPVSAGCATPPAAGCRAP